ITGPDTGTLAAATTSDRQSFTPGDVRWRVFDGPVRKLSKPLYAFTSQRPLGVLGGTESPAKFCPAGMNEEPLMSTSPSLAGDWPSATIRARLAAPPS